MSKNNAAATAEPVYIHAEVTRKLKAAIHLALGRDATESELMALITDTCFVFMIDCKHEYARNRERMIGGLLQARDQLWDRLECLQAGNDSDE